MANYKHGSMDIKEQEKTFDGFIKFAIWTACVCISVLIFMALVNS